VLENIVLDSAVVAGAAGAVTVNTTPLLTTPPTVTATAPVVAPLGTVAAMVVALQLVGVVGNPLNATALDPCVAPKFVPKITTDEPIAPDVGLILEMCGTVEGDTVVELHAAASDASASARSIERLMMRDR
jgi:hypothetical protein